MRSVLTTSEERIKRLAVEAIKDHGIARVMAMGVGFWRLKKAWRPSTHTDVIAISAFGFLRFSM